MKTQDAVLIVDEETVAPTSTSCLVPEQPEQKVEAVVSMPTQEEIDAEALAIAKRLMQQHAKTWTELAKY